MKANFRQFEAFFHVARHGGISAATRACGLERSTLSEHIKTLETSFGVALCRRQPFELTHAGRILFAALEQARGLVDAATIKIRREARPTLRFVTSEVIAQEFLPEIVQQLEALSPGLRCSLDCAGEDQMLALLQQGGADCAIAPAHPGWSGFRQARLIAVPVVLLCPPGHAVRSAGELWARPAIDDVLCVPTTAPTIIRHFDTGLRGLRVAWENRREIGSSIGVVKAVAAGYGFGLALDAPMVVGAATVRVVPLPHFPPVEIAAYWRTESADLGLAVELLRLMAEAYAQTVALPNADRPPPEEEAAES